VRRRTPEESIVDRCLNCQFYDRQANKTDGKGGSAWGQCRRTAPMLSPINAKAYMIEGVWPTVRDDDWCGEWKVGVRRAEPRMAELVAAQAPTPLPTQPRIAALSTLSPVAGAAVAIGANGRGGD
jgi:hypothetical protein